MNEQRLWYARPMVACWLVFALSACASDPAPAAHAPSREHHAKKRAPRATSLSPAQLHRAMSSKGTALAGCYQVSESKNHSDAGSMTIEFEVGMDGRVSGERVAESDLSDGVLGDCVLGVVRQTHFPKATAPTDVSWPVRFRTGD
ncbi:MAG TPA: AgmX/PglI C-terminal domain-containing protein [Polyangiaceae bacterium]|jgi:outer membrane biosynthesis protein TonB